MCRQSRHFDLLKALQAVDSGSVDLQPLSPLGWRSMLVVGTYFIMREIELAFALVGHVTIDSAAAKTTLLLRVSERDLSAVGCVRHWEFLCKERGPARMDCPFRATLDQLEVLRATFGEPLSPTLPLFPSPLGTHVDKA